MTLDELRERIKNELVLNEGNVADWQWTRTGLPAEATELGITDFLRLVDDVSRSLNAQFGKILDLQALIRKLAVDNQKKLSEVQIGGFALDAERLGLSRSFVVEQWVPHILTKIPDPPKEEPAKPNPSIDTPGPAANKSVPAPAPVPASTGGPPPGTLVETAETMQQKVRDILDDYKEHIPAPAIRALFRAINYDEKTLADAVLAYLTANFYASEKEPQGATLREKLTSTDWRHLAWWDQPAPATNVPTSSVPLPPSPAAVSATPAPAVTKSTSTGWRDFLVALLVAGGLIGFVMVLVKSTGSSAKEDRQPAKTEQAGSRTEKETRTPPKRKRSRTADTKAKKQQVDRNSDTEASASAPVPPREEAYDELLDDVGQFGERPARKGSQWGLWRKGKWMVLPVYDEIQVYKDGRAHVSINGNSYDLDKNGNRIR